MYQILLISSLTVTGNDLLAQQKNEKLSNHRGGAAGILLKDSIPPRDSIVFIKGACKNLFISVQRYEFVQPEKISPVITTTVAKVPLITVHGNILYNFSYRSYIDTPFSQTDLMQHLVQTNLNFLIKGKYPLRMTLSNRSSNSPYFKNATDVNVEFNQYQLLNNIKADLRNKATTLVNTNQLTSTEQLYKNKLNRAQELQTWLNSPARVQEIVEEKEKALRGNLPAVPHQQNINSNINGDIFSSARLGEGKGNSQNIWAAIAKQQKTAENILKQKADSLTHDAKDSLQGLVNNKMHVKDSSVSDKISQKKQELEKLQASLRQDAAKLQKEKKNVQDSVAQIRQEINSLKTGSGLFAFMKRHHISKDSLTKGQQLLLSVNKIGIGRSWVDYSELTVKNVSLTGVNIEMNPGRYYFAVAAGKLNYRFRDFILKDNKALPNQSLYLLRAGLGQKDKNNLIFTFYNGKKELLSNVSATTSTTLQNILGVSAEAKLTLNENNYVVTEIAKSSYGNTVNTSSGSSTLNKAFNWKVHSNEAYSIKLFSQYPQTNTRITAYYRKTGQDFQSFNLYPVGTNQEAWMARVNQSFWKRKLTIDASVRKNDFTNTPIAMPSFASTIVFKALQATLRIPKYPFVSVGYYPSSQLSMSNNNILTESQYNTFNTIVSHSYNIKGVAMNTNGVYTKFYNNSSDTGFIYYNASSYTISHSFFIRSLTLQSSIGLTDQKSLHLFTTEQLAGYQFKNRVTLSGSVKWSRLNKTDNLFGGTAALGVYIKRLGTLQFNYDKTYLPGYNRVLVPVDMGRMSFYREF